MNLNRSKLVTGDLNDKGMSVLGDLPIYLVDLKDKFSQDPPEKCVDCGLPESEEGERFVIKFWRKSDPRYAIGICDRCVGLRLQNVRGN